MLFNFEGTSKGQEEIKFIEKEQSRDRGKKALKWGCSSVGRAPALQAGGHGFESHHLHQRRETAEKNGWRVARSKRTSREDEGAESRRADRNATLLSHGLIAQQVRARA